VPGAPITPDFAWLNIPEGFCVHEYGMVPDARQIRFAPGGELFVASPSRPTVGGGAGGYSSIVVLPDDNHDGFADSTLVFMSGLSSTQGILFTNGYLYYQNDTNIMREPYVSGQRKDNGQSQMVTNISVYSSATHWPKTLDVADDGTIFVGNGGDQGEQCQEPMPFHGGVLRLAGTSAATPVMMGMRNPIAVKCHRDGHDLCFATELSRDYSSNLGGREKLVAIRAGDNWGYPCCATTGLPFADQCLTCSTPGTVPEADSSIPCMTAGTCSPDCSSITPETNSFVIGETPFGFDFVDAQFPAPWDHHVILALHGVAGSWVGARVVAIPFDANTGLPFSTTDLDGGVVDGGAPSDFATGWDDGRRDHGRPADVVVSSDGRVFVANDNNGEVFWIAPVVMP
jgi:glucose/arabinose dehydrogenase